MPTIAHRILGIIFLIIVGLPLLLISSFSLIGSIFVPIDDDISFMWFLLIFMFVFGLYFTIYGIFGIIEASNIKLMIDSQKLDVKNRSIYIGKMSKTKLNYFVEEINSLQARDFNYIRRSSDNPESNSDVIIMNNQNNYKQK